MTSLQHWIEEKAPLARLLQSVGAHPGYESGPAVAEAVANLADDTELSDVSTDEVERSDSNDDFAGP